jgi:ribonuclease-3
LQELTAGHVLGVPEYVVEESGPDHQKSFHAVVKVGGRVLGSGHGRSKKAAEQQAAEAAWNAITAEVADVPIAADTDRASADTDRAAADTDRAAGNGDLRPEPPESPAPPER